MGCNANNHYPGCDCGFGGSTRHGEGISPSPRLPASSVHRGSITIPGAECPVCGAPVFYYANSAGSRVFFDELGPPWPKHGCTDNGNPIYAPVSRELMAPRVEQEWACMRVIQSTRQDNEVVRLVLGGSDKNRTLYFKHSIRPFAGMDESIGVREVVFLRRMPGAAYEASYLNRAFKETRVTLYSTAWAARDQKLSGSHPTKRRVVKPS